MPAYEPIHIPSDLAQRYHIAIKTIKKYLTEAFPDRTADIVHGQGGALFE
mgnify:CR=1 FL=1